jgi:acetyl esterase/lipase
MPRFPRMGVLLGMGFLVAMAAVCAADDAPRRTIKRREYGTGARSYWIFEPTEPVAERAPVVAFHHGWLAVNPGIYGAWIEHLVHSGRIVIFPRYQNDVATKPADFLPNALAALRDAFDVLETSPQHIRPDRKRFALIGHSAGGNLSAQIAAVATENGLPQPAAVVACLPGEVKPLREPKLSRIPAETLLVVAAAEDDRVVGDLRARQLFAEASAIPADRKKFFLYRTDLHGSPRLVADHLAPTAYERSLDTGDGVLRGFQTSQAELNALDRAGFWRVADITIEAAFRGLTLDEATAKGELFRHLGYWSDGREVTQPLVTDNLAAIPRVFPTNGLRLFNWTPWVASNPPTQTTQR